MRLRLYFINYLTAIANSTMSHQFSGKKSVVIECVSQPARRFTTVGKKLINETPNVVTHRNSETETQQLKKLIAVLDQMDVLSDRSACLDLIAYLAEHVGYKCAGQTSAVTVAEFMLISARVTQLSESLDDVTFD